MKNSKEYYSIIYSQYIKKYNNIIYKQNIEQCNNCYEYIEYDDNELYECECEQYSCENCWNPELNICSRCSNELNNKFLY